MRQFPLAAGSIDTALEDGSVLAIDRLRGTPAAPGRRRRRSHTYTAMYAPPGGIRLAPCGGAIVAVDVAELYNPPGCRLAPRGLAGFALANGSMSSNQSGEGEIRKNIIEADLVDCMAAMPGQLFYATQIPVVAPGFGPAPT